MSQRTLHIAIIMDGNGRWATRQGLSRITGHRAGAEALRRIVEAAPVLGIGILTVYAFSADNWKRPPDEVEGLMKLLAFYLQTETPRCLKNGVRISVIGRRDRLDTSLRAEIEQAERLTAGCRGLRLRLAIDYSAKDSILSAAELAAGKPVSRERFETLLGHALNDANQASPVDLLIRTGGEQRLSDFLLWESAYAEMIFTDRMWPDFTASDLRLAVQEFRHRGRRFGGLPTQAPTAPASCADERWLR
jgi:undecaprenyl diphosphate synthase